MKKIFTSILLTLSATTFAQIPSYVPSNGLVGWWPFNGNANDESGNGNDGTVNGATLTTDRFGVAAEAYGFNGVSEYILVSHSQSLAITGDMTISLWKKSLGNLGNYETFINKRSTQSNWNYSFGASHYYGVGGCPQEVDKYFTSRRNNSGLQYELKFTDYLVSSDTNNWTHLVVTINQNTVKFFVNGIETGFSCFGNQFNIPSIDVGAPLTIGASLPNFNEYFHGSLDDIGIWNRALTACEIQDLYHAQLGFTTVNAGSDQTICRGELVTLQGVGGSSLTWNNGVINGVPFEPIQTDSYVLTGSDSLGCIGIDTVLVSVLEATTSSQSQTAIDSYTWPVNGQTYTQSGVYVDTLVNAAGCDSIVTLNLELDFTGIESNTPTTFKLYPNPVKDELFIKGMPEAVLPFEVYSTNGNKVLSGTTSGAIDVNALKKGSYQLKMKEQTIPFVKQ
jgi:hypothetical protein